MRFRASAGFVCICDCYWHVGHAVATVFKWLHSPNSQPTNLSAFSKPDHLLLILINRPRTRTRPRSRPLQGWANAVAGLLRPPDFSSLQVTTTVRIAPLTLERSQIEQRFVGKGNGSVHRVFVKQSLRGGKDLSMTRFARERNIRRRQ
jgi:hypothetical protein